MMLFAYSTATNSVHEIVRMENGVMARISTLNVLGVRLHHHPNPFTTTQH